jgi:hypothetical protein
MAGTYSRGGLRYELGFAIYTCLRLFSSLVLLPFMTPLYRLRDPRFYRLRTSVRYLVLYLQVLRETQFQTRSLVVSAVYQHKVWPAALRKSLTDLVGHQKTPEGHNFAFLLF